MQISEISAQGELWISLYEAFDSAILCVPRPQAFHKISLLAAWILILGKGKFRLVAKKNVRKIWSTETSGPSGSNPEFVLPQLRPRHADHSRVSPVLECERPWRGYPMTTALLSLATKSFMMLHGTFEQVSTRLMCSRMARLSASFCAGAVKIAKLRNRMHLQYLKCCSMLQLTLLTLLTFRVWNSQQHPFWENPEASSSRRMVGFARMA